ncbi:hypothetical protein BT93_J1758 [Corymbia citriodora subsp. variegata]|nr:hypothetical protein BT93_J1758 [Corymbia citriodora subsp. variegata]
MAELHPWKCDEAKACARRKGRINGLTRKCASLVRERRARIYILRRCAAMLLRSYICGADH